MGVGGTSAGPSLVWLKGFLEEVASVLGQAVWEGGKELWLGWGRG